MSENETRSKKISRKRYTPDDGIGYRNGHGRKNSQRRFIRYSRKTISDALGDAVGDVRPKTPFAPTNGIEYVEMIMDEKVSQRRSTRVGNTVENLAFETVWRFSNGHLRFGRRRRRK